MELREAVNRLKDHFEVHDDGRPTPLLDEACMIVYEAIDELEQLRILKENGLLLELPCKIGTPVWNTKWWDNKQESVIVDGKKYYRNATKYKVTKDTLSLYDIPSIGIEVFLTRKEAVEACKRKNEEREREE